MNQSSSFVLTFARRKPTKNVKASIESAFIEKSQKLTIPTAPISAEITYTSTNPNTNKEAENDPISEIFENSEWTFLSSASKISLFINTATKANIIPTTARIKPAAASTIKRDYTTAFKNENRTEIFVVGGIGFEPMTPCV